MEPKSFIKSHPGATVAGSVKIQQSTISKATPQRTLENLRAAPAPTIDEVIICVVETGMPKIADTGTFYSPPSLLLLSAKRRFRFKPNIAFFFSVGI